MRHSARSLPAWFAAALLAAVLCGALAWRIAEQRARDALIAATRSDVRLRVALLDSEIARFRLMPRTLADDRDVVAALRGDAAARAALDRKLEALARDTGAVTIYVIDGGGRTIAASNWRTPASFVGNHYGFRRYFRAALADGEASQFALGTVSRHPGLYLARRATAGGVVVVKLAFDRVERDWARAGGVSYATDAAGVVLVSSRPDWRFAASVALPPAAVARFRAAAMLGPGTLRPLPADPRSVSASAASAQPGWRVTLRRSPQGILSGARTAAAATALAVLAAFAIAWMLRERAALRARRTAELEQAVDERTAALRREMDERAAIEARAATLREGLRQANRLATLGQVTAGVAHETAQPVAAIRTYAQSSVMLLDRGETGPVRDNLAAIARLADRIAAVTAELRGFSRRRTDEIRAVPLTEVIDGALLILKEQLRGVTLDRPPGDPALLVLGGRVRLEQVLVNLLQNAVEALAGRPAPRITLTIAATADSVAVTVADNGPGVAPDIAGRLFTPFVTGRDDGLGLGLVIAHDIMLDLGGALRPLPGDGGGARFELRMRRA